MRAHNIHSTASAQNRLAVLLSLSIYRFSKMDSDDDICDVEVILDSRFRGPQVQYLVKWKGSNEEAWVKGSHPDTDLAGLIKQYKVRQKRAKRAKERAARAKMRARREDPAPVSGSRSATCVVCLTNQAEYAYDPCGHLATCGYCTAFIKNRTCPVCRTRYRKTLRIYLPGAEESP